MILVVLVMVLVVLGVVSCRNVFREVSWEARVPPTRSKHPDERL